MVFKFYLVLKIDFGNFFMFNVFLKLIMKVYVIWYLIYLVNVFTEF